MGRKNGTEDSRLKYKFKEIKERYSMFSKFSLSVSTKLNNLILNHFLIFNQKNVTLRPNWEHKMGVRTSKQHNIKLLALCSLEILRLLPT